MPPHDRSRDRPGDRGGRAGRAQRDDTIVVPPRRPTAARPGGDSRAGTGGRTELEARGRPAGPVRFAELSEWAASRQAPGPVPVDPPGSVTTPDDAPSSAATAGAIPEDAAVGDVVERLHAMPDVGTITGVVPMPPTVLDRLAPTIDRGPGSSPYTFPVTVPSPFTVPAPPTAPVPLPAAPVVAALPAAPAAEPVAAHDASRQSVPVVVSTRRSILRRRPRVRRVSRVVRRVDAWSVFKVSVILYALAYLILLVAGVLLWKVAIETGTLANIEGFVKELFGLTTFELNGQELYRASWTVGAFLVVAGTGLNVTAAVMFNLITDLVGGVRVTVLEEEVRLVERGPRRRERRAAARAAAQASASSAVLSGTTPADGTVPPG